MILFPRNIALAVCAALLGAVVFMGGTGTTESRAIEPVVRDFDASRVRSIVVSGLDAEGNHVVSTLSRKSIGEPWTIGERFGAPAIERRIDGLLADIGAMTNLDVVSEDAKGAGKYGLTEKDALRIVLSAEASAEPAAGSPADSPTGSSAGNARSAQPIVDLLVATAGKGAAFVRKAGETRVVRVPRFPRFGLTRIAPRDWLDARSIVPLTAREIIRVDVSGMAVPAPFTVMHPRGDLSRFEDADGRVLPDAESQAFFELLGTLFPLDVVAALDAAEMAALENGGATDEIAEFEARPLVLKVTPAIGSSFQVIFESVGRTGGESPERGIAFRSNARTKASIDAAQIERLLKDVEKLRVAGK